MVPLLKFYFHEEVRSAAAQSLPELLRSASLAAAKAGAAGTAPDAAFVRSMLGFMWAPLMEALGKEPDNEILVTMLEAADELVDIAQGPQLLPLEEVRGGCRDSEMLSVSGEAIGACRTRIADVVAQGWQLLLLWELGCG